MRKGDVKRAHHYMETNVKINNNNYKVLIVSQGESFHNFNGLKFCLSLRKTTATTKVTELSWMDTFAHVSMSRIQTLIHKDVQKREK